MSDDECVCGCLSGNHEHHRDPDEFRACLNPHCPAETPCQDYQETNEA